MRRLLAISILAVFSLAPLSALVPGADEMNLPACCRRHGAHHCAMAMAAAMRAQSSGPAFSAPDRCPHYPAQIRATAAPYVFAHFAAAHARSALRLRVIPARASSVSRSLTHTGRGPPAGI